MLSHVKAARACLVWFALTNFRDLAAEQRSCAVLSGDCIADTEATQADTNSMDTNLLMQTRAEASRAQRGAAKPYVSGGPVWPNGAASSYPWAKAKKKLHNLPERMPGLKEAIWASERTKPCGDPCVAHCLAGQPRDILRVKGLWKAYKHRLFERFSDSPVVFAVYAASADMGDVSAGGYGNAGFVRTLVAEAADSEMIPGFEYMQVDRALVIREPCETGSCLKKGAGLSCEAKPLGLTANFDKTTGNQSNFCDVQVRRFQTCMHLVREYEQEHSTKFAWVARDRPDVYFAQPAGRYTKLNQDTVYVKPWTACGYGGMDWWYVMPRHHADTLARFPDEMKCEYLQHKKVQPICKDCLGCECFLAAWMLAQNVKFERVPSPWDGFIPYKFCGGGCAMDWEVSPTSICQGKCKQMDNIHDAIA